MSPSQPIELGDGSTQVVDADLLQALKQKWVREASSLDSPQFKVVTSNVKHWPVHRRTAAAHVC